MNSMTTMTEKPKLNPILKLTLDIGPLVLFFLANSRLGIFAATGAFMVAVVAALLVSYTMTRQWPIMPVVTAIVVVVFGGLTLALHDETFIKLKPTIIYALFGGILIGGYILEKPFLAILFDSMFHLTPEGWRKLTLRWALFFLAHAVDRLLGEFQAVRLRADHFCVCRPAIPAVDAVCGGTGAGRGIEGSR